MQAGLLGVGSVVDGQVVVEDQDRYRRGLERVGVDDDVNRGLPGRGVGAALGVAGKGEHRDHQGLAGEGGGDRHARRAAAGHASGDHRGVTLVDGGADARVGRYAGRSLKRVVLLDEPPEAGDRSPVGLDRVDGQGKSASC